MADTLGGDLQAALAGAFTIERELGGGGMSRVFLATDQALGRRVVIKVVAPELARGVSADRFRREIQVAAGLQHPSYRARLLGWRGPRFRRQATASCWSDEPPNHSRARTYPSPARANVESCASASWNFCAAAR
jgi:serine/threonine protein kinase